MPLTLYLSSVQKVEVTPDKVPLSACDNIVIAGTEYSITENKPSVTTNSTIDDSNKKWKNTSLKKYNLPRELILRIAQSAV